MYGITGERQSFWTETLLWSTGVLLYLPTFIANFSLGYRTSSSPTSEK
jgi:hypothetical protein